MKPRVPYSQPFLTGKEESFLKETMRSCQWAGDGPFSKKCTEVLNQLTGKSVFLTASGTQSLELAMMALDLETGSEVILPSFTFTSTANAVVNFGLKPVFVDIRRDTLNMDETLIEKSITPKTRAILPVHYAGVGCDMQKILEIAQKNNLKVVEDAAQGVGAYYDSKPLGT